MFVIQPVERYELRRALDLLVARPSLPRAEAAQQIDSLLRYAESRGLSLDQCLAARCGGRPIATCLCVDAPGRTSTTFIPADASTEHIAKAVVELLNETARRAGNRGIRLLQGLVRPDAPGDASLYDQAGFRPLAQLLYLESDLSRLALPPAGSRRLSWKTYGPQTHALFAEVLEGTYAESLDCAALNGLRPIEDVLASHRGVGEFDPACWMVALEHADPVGAILLGYVPDLAAFEVVYMGILPQHRRQGYGTALLRRGVQTALEHAVNRLTLAVDSRNTPARTLYGRFGFIETTRRDVWIRILTCPNDRESKHPSTGS